MPIATEHQGVIAFEFIGINDRSAPDRFHGEIQKGSSLNVLDHLDLDDSVSLQDAENRDFAGSPTAPFAFAPASEIGLVKFDFALEEFIFPCRAAGNSHPDHIKGFEHRGITQGGLLGDFPGRQFQFKEFDDPQPLLETDSQTVDPSSREVMKSIFATFAPQPLADNLIYCVAPASDAEMTVVFPT